MSEELKKVVPETNGNKENVENKENKENIEKRISDGTEARTVPLASMIAERKKFQKQIDELKDKAGLTDDLAEMSHTDTAGLKKRIIEMKKNPQYNQPYQQQTQYSNTSELEEKLKRLTDSFELSEQRKELEAFSKTGLLELTSEMEDDVLAYAKEKKMTVQKAIFAQYGETIIDVKAKTLEHDAKSNGAAKVFSSATSGGSIPGSGKVELTALQSEYADRVGMSKEKYAILQSGDADAIAQLYKK